MAKDAPGMKGYRPRNLNGELRDNPLSQSMRRSGFLFSLSFILTNSIIYTNKIQFV